MIIEAKSIPPESIPCIKCKKGNLSDASFCNACGSPLALPEFISQEVLAHVSGAVRDRDVLETESAVRVFERAWGWFKILGSLATLLLAIVGGGILWQVSDWRSSVEKAKQSVTDNSTAANRQIATISQKTLQQIGSGAATAEHASNAAIENASRLSTSFERNTQRTRAELQEEAATVHSEVSKTRDQLSAVNTLQPEFLAMREQLGRATEAIQAQQKVLTSSEEFAKQIFSSHTYEYFELNPFVKPRSIVVPRDGDKGVTLVYMLLPYTPVPGTTQLQYNIFVQLPSTYTNIHNLVIFFWGDPPENLKDKPTSVSYFPDKTDKQTIQTISFHDGRVFADDQPMPLIGRADPDFKGNKWIPVLPIPKN